MKRLQRRQEVAGLMVRRVCPRLPWATWVLVESLETDASQVVALWARCPMAGFVRARPWTVWRVGTAQAAREARARATAFLSRSTCAALPCLHPRPQPAATAWELWSIAVRPLAAEAVSAHWLVAEAQPEEAALALDFSPMLAPPVKAWVLLPEVAATELSSMPERPTEELALDWRRLVATAAVDERLEEPASARAGAEVAVFQDLLHVPLQEAEVPAPNPFHRQRPYPCASCRLSRPTGAPT